MNEGGGLEDFTTRDREPSGGRRIGSINARFLTDGAKVRQIRVERNLTQTKLAEMADLSKGMMSGVEKHNQRLSPIALARLARALSIPMEELALGDVGQSIESDHLTILKSLRSKLMEATSLTTLLIDQVRKD